MDFVMKYMFHIRFALIVIFIFSSIMVIETKYAEVLLMTFVIIFITLLYVLSSIEKKFKSIDLSVFKFYTAIRFILIYVAFAAMIFISYSPNLSKESIYFVSVSVVFWVINYYLEFKEKKNLINQSEEKEETFINR
ncbi:hypothetical protein [Mammaliicoccus stepanovicii]|uniref:Uncharacterized protein n=1 Tax=Mammaliicoccus stepanovicii TaxID=643214 RepID=A0A239Y8C3_9STAP|nr:hypothetical protein [Mammaliicoccus stepanovicii]PNZ77047.1 hypothetical protein CD111_05335 [Mammaliicoccus stepanovicii]GGI43499.1 hypothetical protein GCM10010896_23720 [Mammaliicoccus stepanovicii]SNV55117.1 Uncharacterised protein [Mammaliicoccus stepanovicii]